MRRNKSAALNNCITPKFKAAVEKDRCGRSAFTPVTCRNAANASLPPSRFSASRVEVAPIEVGWRRQGNIAVIPVILADAILWIRLARELARRP
jgi:hypothetical protein